MHFQNALCLHAELSYQCLDELMREGGPWWEHSGSFLVWSGKNDS